MTKDGKILVGVSSCLLGHRVRYDGQSKAVDYIVDKLATQLEFVAVCPEVEAGLGVPRPAIHLVDDLVKPRIIGVVEPQLDVSEQLYYYCDRILEKLSGVCGFILKARSPSCGIASVSIKINETIYPHEDGVFAALLREKRPDLPLVDEEAIVDPALRQIFLHRVQDYYRKQR